MGIGMFDRIIDVTDRIHDGEGRPIREISTIQRECPGGYAFFS